MFLKQKNTRSDHAKNGYELCFIKKILQDFIHRRQGEVKKTVAVAMVFFLG
jgi:hypothetical protein